MNDWTWSYHDYRPDEERLREALCTLGNGYFATRGAAPEADAGERHYPGTYLAGGYDRLKSEVQGRSVENEDLVNLPNWLVLKLAVRDRDADPDTATPLDPDATAPLAYRQTLDLRDGILVREVLYRDARGRETRVIQRRLVHMGQPHLAAMETEVEALNWSGTLAVTSALDGRVTNAGVARYRGLRGDHLEPMETAAVEEDGVLLKVRTRQSRLEIAMAARLAAWCDSRRLDLEPRLVQEPGYIAQDLELKLDRTSPVRLDKTLALYSSRDRAISECALEARKAIGRAPPFGELLEGHALLWRQLWRRFDLELTLDGAEESMPEASRGGPPDLPPDAARTQRVAAILRLHIFHLLTVASPNVRDLDVGVPARGLHGEAYRGHIFWDELFIFPTLNLRLPEIARSLLLYRFRRLGEARANARAAGLAGAMFPWQSGSDGREESQALHLNPRSGRWTPDDTHLQRHVGSAIAYNVWQYYEITGDTEFLSSYGAEMLLEIARFWASLATRNQTTGRFEIRGVIGPDEFHTAYPDRDEPGLDNHAYTSVLAAWALCRALDLPEHLPNERWTELKEQLEISQDELDHWDTVSRRLTVCFFGDGIIEQYTGFASLAELDWDAYRQRYGDIQRLDRILEAEGDTPNRYQAAKQADVLMLFYLFSSEELTRLFSRLGYRFDPEQIPRNVAYYGARTSHGSTLSRVVDAWVLARSDRPRAWSLFTQALESDVADVQGGTTAEGIHLGAMAGTVDLIQRCFAGIEVRDRHLWIDPVLPEELKGLKIRLRFRGQTLEIEIGEDLVRVRALSPEADTLRLGTDAGPVELPGGGTLEIQRSRKPLFVDTP